jgi:hypothetical protein
VKLRPALVLYAHQHRPHVTAAVAPALLGLGSFKDGQASAVVLDSADTGRLVRELRAHQTLLKAKLSKPPRIPRAASAHTWTRCPWEALRTRIPAVIPGPVASAAMHDVTA